MKNRYLTPAWRVPLLSLACFLVSTIFARAQTAPFIAAGPDSQIVAVGSNVTFSVSASGSDPLFFQWRYNGTNLTDDGRIVGSSTSSLIISNAQYADAGAYSVVVSNSVSFDTSTNAQLQIFSGFTLGEATDATNLVWETDPANPWTWQNYSTHDGLDAAQSGPNWWISSYMQTSVEGPAAVNFWWRASFHPSDHMAVLIDGNELARVSGVTPWENPSFFIPAGAHVVRWLYSKDQAFGMNDIKGYVDQVTVSAPTLPVIVTGPTSQTVPVGTNITLTGSATGMLPIAYQWQFNGTNLNGATTTSLALNNLQLTNSGEYSLVVSNGAGFVTNGPANINVTPAAPFITQQPQSQSVYYNVSASFSVAATGTEPFSYQWQFNGTNLDGATSSTFTLPLPQYTNAGSYRVIVSNAVGATLSAPAILTVLDRALISISVSNKTALLGALTTLTVSASAFSPSYQWRFNGTNLPSNTIYSGATSPTLTISKTRSNMAGVYSVIVSNAYTTASAKCELTLQNVTAWGAGTTTNYSEPNYAQSIIPPDMTRTVAISAGRYHSMALNNDGTVVAWGAKTNQFQQQVFFGQTIVPPGLSNVMAIAAGGYHSLALKNDGTVVAWGAGTVVNLGHPFHLGQSMVPTNLTNVKAIAAGYRHSLALRNDGTVVSWGQQTNVPAGLGNVTAIAAGHDHSVALLTNGTVMAWGIDNTFSQTNVPSSLSNVVEIAAGDYHSLALKNDGTIVTWGKPVGTPPSPGGYVEIAAGGDHSIGLKTNATVSIWGASGNGLSPVPNLPYVTGVAAGYLHNIVLLGDGLPVIKHSPVSRKAFAGETGVAFNVLAVRGGDSSPAYQWRRNGTNITGSALSSYQFPSAVQYGNAGTYDVVVSNGSGSVTSAPAVLTITTTVSTTNLGQALDATNLTWITTGDAPWFGQTNTSHGGGSAAQSGFIGDSQQSSLQTTVMGPGTLSFWASASSEQFFDILSFYIGGTLKTNISGTNGWTQRTYTIAPGTQTLEWRYVKDSNFIFGLDACWVDQVSYTPSPAFFITQPQSQTVRFGDNVELSAQAVGAGPIQYQWMRFTLNIPGATNATLLLTNAIHLTTGDYKVVITNPGGVTNSSIATLTVQVPQRVLGSAIFPDGSFRLTSGYADNFPLFVNDLPRFEALVSSNLVDWITLSNSLSVANAKLQLTDTEATNWPTRYYRIVEH